MKKTRVAILFLLLTLFAACLPAAAELPAQTPQPCLGKDRVHKLIGYFALGNRHCGIYKCTHCGREGVYYSPSEEHSGGTETPTCTTGKTCALCGAEYGILGHDWDAWTSNGDGTHTSQTALALQVAVPPVQLLVSASSQLLRLHLRVCVPSPLDVHASQS